MAQFIINPAVRFEINLVESCGTAFNDKYKSVDKGNILGCTTSALYQHHTSDIKSVFSSYSELVRKDANDIARFVNNTNLLDQLLASKY